ncbi:MAG: hypothetical protein JWR69_3412 [Pedosphaera sp.]|nr:hypothetical protein [Pedosphaera sp.]
MPTYSHLQELKRAEQLPNPQRIGACLTCRFWDAEGSRDEALAPTEALCLQPELRNFQLIVSGGSGCNRWEKQPGVSAEAEAYARRGEEYASS